MWHARWRIPWRISRTAAFHLRPAGRSFDLPAEPTAVAVAPSGEYVAVALESTSTQFNQTGRVIHVYGAESCRIAEDTPTTFLWY